MAVELTGGRRPVTARHFVRLKLRVTGNNFRGQGGRIALFVAGWFFAVTWSVLGFFLLAAPGLADAPEYAPLAGGLGGGLLTLGWVLMPLVFFGVDETLEPGRFALLPLSRRTLATGLFAAALVSVPVLATLVGTLGLVLSAGLLGGPLAALAALLGVVAGLLVCVAASRAITSAFAGMLRSRRVRDLAAALLAGLAALLGPVQLALSAALRHADWGRLTGIGRVVGWTPLAAPYTVGMEVAEGRLWAALAKVAITALTLFGLLAWWSRTLESAMLGTSRSGTPVPSTAAATVVVDNAVDRLFPHVVSWLPRNRFGALVARELRYWWRDTRRRASLVTIAVLGVFLPVMTNVGADNLVAGQFSARPDPSSSPALASFSVLIVGLLASLTLANQFGFDGSAYAAHLTAGVPGRVELRARATAFSLFLVPLLVAVSVLVVLVLHRPTWFGAVLGTILATYGTGLAINQFVSVLGAYALPESTNPFAVKSGASMTKGLLTLVSMAGSAVFAAPMVVAAALLGDGWLWLALPLGVAYGAGAALLGTYLAGDVLDRRMPELLQAVSPRR